MKPINEWLSRQVRKRDKGKFENPIQFRQIILRAIKRSNWRDAYTDDSLDWKLIYSPNLQRGTAKYKNQRIKYPSIDHINGRASRAVKICALRTNDAKSDMSYKQLLDFCRKVLKTDKAHRRRGLRR